MIVGLVRGTCFQVVLPRELPHPWDLSTAAGDIAVLISQILPPHALPDKGRGGYLAHGHVVAAFIIHEDLT